MRHYPEFPQGSRTWDERVYHPDANGVIRPLSELWPERRGAARHRADHRDGAVDGPGPGVRRTAHGLERSDQLRLALGEQGF